MLLCAVGPFRQDSLKVPLHVLQFLLALGGRFSAHVMKSCDESLSAIDVLLLKEQQKSGCTVAEHKWWWTLSVVRFGITSHLSHGVLVYKRTHLQVFYVHIFTRVVRLMSYNHKAVHGCLCAGPRLDKRKRGWGWGLATTVSWA